MANPVLVEATRGNVIESRHRGAFVVTGAAGAIVAAAGDVEAPVFPRSAVKVIQALPLVESGAADAFGFGDRELALACASHNGEVEHVECAAAMLRRAGRDVAALECGAHWPGRQDATVALARAGGMPSALHNNCSGKHAGFVSTCVHLGLDPAGYVRPDHAFQRELRGVMETVTGAAHGDDVCGIDGCSIPTYAVSLRALAHGFARMATGEGLGASRAAAARRLFAACMAQPFHVAGTDRVDTEIMRSAPGRLFVKIGAEGVYCGAVPELGLGLALKCDDGAGRAAEVMVAALLAGLLGKAGRDAPQALLRVARPTLRNWNGIVVGTLRPAGPLAKD